VFCSTHDKLAAWVKTSILSNTGLGKRADIIDFWIRVAEVSNVLHNEEIDFTCCRNANCSTTSHP
jgi:son of sevenless-like protein